MCHFVELRIVYAYSNLYLESKCIGNKLSSVVAALISLH
jgi:hypothetical protein